MYVIININLFFVNNNWRYKKFELIDLFSKAGWLGLICTYIYGRKLCIKF